MPSLYFNYIGIKFNKKLTEFYKEVNATETLMEVVYFSYDKSKQTYEEFKKGMPWLCLQYMDPKIKDIQHRFNVITIHHLIIMKPDGTVAIQNARAEVEGQDEQIFDDWLVKFSPQT